MKVRLLASAVGVVMAALVAPMTVSVQAASAAPAGCSDVDVVFARGTAEPPGMDLTGTTFVASLRALAGGRSVSEYPVNYPASADFGNRDAFIGNIIDGIRDVQSHIQATAANCPGTKIVLGGYSQGAVVNGFATTPAAVAPEYRSSLPAPLSPQAAGKIAAVVNFGRPSDRFMQDAGAPPITAGPAYVSKTVDYCIPFDNICDGQPLAQPNPLHVLYSVDGMTVAGAQYAVSHL